MIDLWLRSGTVGIVLVPLVLLNLIAFGIVWLTHLSPARPFFATFVGVCGPFFAAVSILFGLFSAFLANDVHSQNAAINAAISKEADGIRTMLRIAEALGPAGDPIEAAAVTYTRAVLEKEWPAKERWGSEAEDLGALRSLSVAILTPSLSAALPAAAHEVILESLVEVRQARRERLDLVAGERDHMNWVAMVILGVLTQVAVAVVHLDKMRPQAMALAVFTAAFAATAILIGLAERPDKELNDSPLRVALATAAG
ncbi:MAG: hypothetical protein U1E45_12100 [Geminicoccaceae bacterium]